MTIFLDDRDYRRFFYLLREVLEEFQVECWNYCAMPNHYHATLRPLLPNISAAMQKLNGRYAQWWNHRHTKVGHVFQGRFKAQIVQEDRYAVALSKYVALNPVRAQLVGRPEDWQWSSYAPTVGLRPMPGFLAADATLALFGDGDRATLQQRFAEFVLARRDDESLNEEIRSNSKVLGDSAFKQHVETE